MWRRPPLARLAFESHASLRLTQSVLPRYIFLLNQDASRSELTAALAACQGIGFPAFEVTRGGRQENVNARPGEATNNRIRIYE